MNYRPLLAAAALLGAASLPAAAQQAAPFNAARLDSLLAQLAADNHLMASVAVSHDGHLLYSRAVGFARQQPLVPATPATRYRIGSISKVFTAVLIFQLIEEKKLTLDTPLATFFPELPNASTITIDQLLSHRSGLHSFTDDAAYTGYMTQPRTQAQMLALIKQGPPDFAPGAKYSYSNSGYVVLGYIAEQLAQQPYAQLVQQRIARRAGLRSTGYGGHIDPAQQQALSYEWAGTAWQLAPETDMSIPGGAGALVSTPTDLARFLTALFGGKLVSSSSLAAMQAMRDNYGRGLMDVKTDGEQGYGHSGGIDGFRSMAVYYPADKLAVTYCSNGAASTGYVLTSALKVYHDQPYRLPDLRSTGYQPTAADLDRYAGTYACPQLPLKVTMTREGTQLRSQATGQNSFVLEPVAQGRFQFKPAGIQVSFDPAKPTFTLQQGGGSFEFSKQP